MKFNVETEQDCVHIWKCIQTNPKKFGTDEHKKFYRTVVIPKYKELTGKDLPSFSNNNK